LKQFLTHVVPAVRRLRPDVPVRVLEVDEGDGHPVGDVELLRAGSYDPRQQLGPGVVACFPGAAGTEATSWLPEVLATGAAAVAGSALADGLGLQADEYLLVAEGEGLAGAALHLLANPDLADRLAEGARNAVAARPWTTCLEGLHGWLTHLTTLP